MLLHPACTNVHGAALTQRSPDPGAQVRAALAGAGYFGIVFTLGFAFGVLRTLFVVPHAGELGAVLIELPLILGCSWIACRFLVRRFDVAAQLAERAVMGVVAFALLMAAELALSSLLAGRSLAEHLALYGQAAHLLGLAGQLAFAAFPAIQLSGPRTLQSPQQRPGDET